MLSLYNNYKQNGIPTIGILGCPNLPISPNDEHYVWDESETDDNNQNIRGCIFVASQGGGCYQLPLTPGAIPPTQVHVTPQDESIIDIQNARFCIGKYQKRKHCMAVVMYVGPTKHINTHDF